MGTRWELTWELIWELHHCTLNNCKDQTELGQLQSKFEHVKFADLSFFSLFFQLSKVTTSSKNKELKDFKK